MTTPEAVQSFAPWRRSRRWLILLGLISAIALFVGILNPHSETRIEFGVPSFVEGEASAPILTSGEIPDTFSTSWRQRDIDSEGWQQG